MCRGVGLQPLSATGNPARPLKQFCLILDFFQKCPVGFFQDLKPVIAELRAKLLRRQDEWHCFTHINRFHHGNHFAILPSASSGRQNHATKSLFTMNQHTFVVAEFAKFIGFNFVFLGFGIIHVAFSRT